MVRVGFIVEGDTEKVLIDSEAFRQWALHHGIQILDPVIDAAGGGNLLPKNIAPLVERLQMLCPDHVAILTDSEGHSVADVRDRIGTTHTNLVFVAVKAIEAWFLADDKAMAAWLEAPSFHEAAPEATPALPWDRLKDLAHSYGRRGPGASKVGFAKQMTRHHGFSIAKAASHPACPSATGFQDTLIAL